MPKIIYITLGGDLEFRQVCNSKDLDTILDLGYQPLVDIY